MKLSYALSRESLSQGMSAGIAYRRPILRFLRPVLGIIFLIAAAYFFIANESSDWHFGLAASILGGLYLIYPTISRRKALNNIFAGKEEPIEISAIIHTDKLEMITNNSSASCTWDTFVDFHIHQTGILLYPQKGIFYWFPKEALFQEGSWQEFCDLISSKIVRKV